MWTVHAVYEITIQIVLEPTEKRHPTVIKFVGASRVNKDLCNLIKNVIVYINWELSHAETQAGGSRP
jgi:hypothetical protein